MKVLQGGGLKVTRRSAWNGESGVQSQRGRNEMSTGGEAPVIREYSLSESSMERLWWGSGEEGKDGKKGGGN